MQTMMARPSRFALATYLALFVTVVWAGTTYADYLRALADRESSMNPSANNSQTHYIGLFQMGEAALQDIGVYGGDGTRTNDWTGAWTGKFGATSQAAFLASPDAQLKAITAYQQTVWNKYLVGNGAGAYLGKTINGIPITESGLIAAAHLVGAGPVLTWLRSNGATAPADAMGTLMTDYMQKFGGYAISATAPTFADLKGGSPSGGTGTSVTTPTSGNSGGGGSGVVSTSPYASSAEGFKGSTGYWMSDVKKTFNEMVASIVLLWLASIVFTSFRGYQSGNLTAMELKFNTVRGAILVGIIVVLLS